MPQMKRLRLYHAILALAAISAYASGEAGIIHAWLGYGVAVIIVFRLGWALAGPRELGLARFYPKFGGLKAGNLFTHPAISRFLLLGIALSLIGVTATGLMMDRGRAMVGAAHERPLSALGQANQEREGAGNGYESEDGEENESALGELHETLANLLLLLVAAHVAYLFAFKRPIARFMLFLDTPKVM